MRVFVIIFCCFFYSCLLWAELPSGNTTITGDISITSTNATTRTISLTGLVGTNYYVSTTGSNGNNGLSEANAFETLDHAVDNVPANNIINVGPGTFSADSDITINNSMIIKGSGRDKTIFDGSSGSGGFIAITASNVTIQDMTIQDYTDSGQYSGGAAIRIGTQRGTQSTESRYTGILLKNIKFYNNDATHSEGYGGAIHMSVSSNASNTVADIEQCLFYDNYAEYLGGVLYMGDGNTANISNSVMVDNRAKYYGQAVYVSDVNASSDEVWLTINFCTIYTNPL